MEEDDLLSGRDEDADIADELLVNKRQPRKELEQVSKSHEIKLIKGLAGGKEDVVNREKTTVVRREKTTISNFRMTTYNQESKNLVHFAKKAYSKQKLLIHEYLKRQISYFTVQQNKFMKATNKEGGMREDQNDGLSIM